MNLNEEFHNNNGKMKLQKILLTKINYRLAIDNPQKIYYILIILTRMRHYDNELRKEKKSLVNCNQFDTVCKGKLVWFRSI